MKYVLILYLCSMLDNSCFESTITSHEYPTYYDCALSGYKLSHNTLMKLDILFLEEHIDLIMMPLILLCFTNAKA